MKAVVFKGIGSIVVEEVKEPSLKNPHDAIVRLTLSGICGTDLHLIRGSVTGMEKGTILGHEGVGIVESVGAQVKKIKIGDRVIVSATLSCGQCDYCQQEQYSQCDTINPQGKEAGTVFLGSPRTI